MRGSTGRLMAACALTALLGAGMARAEVRAVQKANKGWSVEVNSMEGHPWTPIPEHAFDQHVLNAAGDLAGDGAPSVGVRPWEGTPEAVWAAATPTGYELVHSRHDGNKWLAPRRVTVDAQNTDTNPRLAFDDHSRSMLVWRRHDGQSSVMVGGLSIETRLWGPRPVEIGEGRPVAIGTDGDGYVFATLNAMTGALRIYRVDFPFPNGGAALPFPDDNLLLGLVIEEDVGEDTGFEAGGPGGPHLGPGPAANPAMLAGLTFDILRVDNRLLVSWLTPDSGLRWLAIEGSDVLGEGLEGFSSPNQVDMVRRRLARVVADL